MQFSVCVCVFDNVIFVCEQFYINYYSIMTAFVPGFFLDFKHSDLNKTDDNKIIYKYNNSHNHYTFIR